MSETRSVVAGLLRSSPIVGGLVAAGDAANLYGRQSELANRFQSRSNIILPEDLNRNQNTPFMSMEFVEYTRRSIYAQPFFRDTMRIRLPIPENLTENTSVTYDKSANLGSVAGSMVEAVSGGVSSANGGNILERLGTAASGLGVGAAGSLLQSAARLSGVSNETVTTGLNALQVLSGITTNPFQVVMFKSPDFRSHTFSWRFVPRNKVESDRLKDLIFTFKYHSLPGISALGGVFFSYPEILKINFRPTSEYLYEFKPCVVESIQVNYAPNSPSFYRTTNAPTAVQITIRVQEIEIWTKADYLRNEQGRVGNELISERLRNALANPNLPTPGAAAAFPGSVDPNAFGLGAGGF